VQFSNITLQWNITFIRSMHDWKVDVVSLFFNLLYTLRLQQEEDAFAVVVVSSGEGLNIILEDGLVELVLCQV
jgi:hypothetical protein